MTELYKVVYSGTEEELSAMFDSAKTILEQAYNPDFVYQPSDAGIIIEFIHYALCAKGVPPHRLDEYFQMAMEENAAKNSSFKPAAIEWAILNNFERVQ